MIPSFSKPLIWCGISPSLLLLLLLLRGLLLLHLRRLHSMKNGGENKKEKGKKSETENDKKNEHADECQWVDSEKLRGKYRDGQIYSVSIYPYERGRKKTDAVRERKEHSERLIRAGKRGRAVCVMEWRILWMTFWSEWHLELFSAEGRIKAHSLLMRGETAPFLSHTQQQNRNTHIQNKDSITHEHAAWRHDPTVSL